MHDSKDTPDVTRSFGADILPIIGLLVVTFGGAVGLTYAPIDDRSKLIGSGALIAVFVIACIAMYIRRSKRKIQQTESSLGPENVAHVGEVDPEKPLAELDEAQELFSGALKLADAFRLISNRIGDVMPFKAIVLHTLNDRRTRMVPAHADGIAKEAVDDGLANQSHTTGRVEIDSYLEMDSSQIFESSAAIPLRTDGTGFAVLQLYFAGDYDAASVDKYLFEAVGQRVSTFVLASIAYERSHANALTDITTDLPNERAFYLALEQQIADSDNNDGGVLTVLAIDIKDFEDINDRHGHPIGDQVLNFVAQVTTANLRQMDFLARSVNDEFLAILPTATSEVTQKIIQRIHNAFATRKLDITDGESIAVELNIGWATYDNEGRTPAELLSFAEMKKEQLKSPAGKNVLAFRQQLVG